MNEKPMIGMRCRLSSLQFYFPLVQSAEKAFADVNAWNSNGPYGGNIISFAFDPTAPTTVYAGPSGEGDLY